MNTIQTSIGQKLQNVATMVAVKCINGTSFVGVQNYLNSNGELSNQTFLVGIDYGKLLQKDLDTLNAFDFKTLYVKDTQTHNGSDVTAKKYNETIVKAYTELVTSLVKRTATELEKEILRSSGDSTMNRSDGQSEAFEHVAKGLKSKDEQLYIYGLCVRKTVLIEGDYPSVKSQLKTVLKNKIKKATELKELKYKQFKLGEFETLNIQGMEI